MSVESQTRSPVPRPSSRGDLDCVDISVTYRGPRDTVESLRRVSIRADRGKFISIVGPSGCGKSTLFAVLAGLRQPDSGSIRLAGEEVTGRVGLVGLMPQRDLLLPWKTVLDNTALPLRLRGVSTREARTTASHLFLRFGLAGFEGAMPSSLSGGMRQRAALLRTFLTGHDVLLLDEPFGALDALTRADMQEWLLDVWSSSGKTIVLVTHDVDEAIYLSDQVSVMTPRPGQIAAVMDVPFPRPRAHVDIVTSAPFVALKRELLNYLRAAGGGHA